MARYTSTYYDPSTGKTVTVTGSTQAAADAAAVAGAKKTAAPTTPTTIPNPFGSGGAGQQQSILYPSGSAGIKSITAALVNSGADAVAAATLAKKLSGTAILPSSAYLDSKGNISSSGLDAIRNEILFQGGPALFQAVFGNVPGFNANEYITSGTKIQGSLQSGLLQALNYAGSKTGGDLSKLPKGVTYGPGLTAAQQASRDTLTEAVSIAGKMTTQIANATASANLKNSSYQTLDQWLQSVDLGAIAPEVYKWTMQDNITNPKELMNMVRKTSQYKSTFSGLIAQQAEAAKNGTKPLTESTYLTLVNSYQATAQAAGLPTGFLTTPDPKTGKSPIANLVAGNVSASEFSQRIAMGYQAVNALPQNIQQQFMQQHNIGQGGLVAYFLNPTAAAPVLERQALSANLGYTAQTAGLQGFTNQQSSDLAEMVRLSGTGASVAGLNDPTMAPFSKAQQALQTAARDVSLTKAAPGAAAPTVDTNTLIGSQIAGFGGTSQPAAQQAVALAEQGALAPFEKGGGYSETAKGVTGLGAART